MLRVRSLVGLVPLFAADTLETRMIDRHPGFKKRMQWFLDNRKDLTEGLAPMTECGMEERRLLSVVNRPRLERILQRVFDQSEFLSPFGICSLSGTTRTILTSYRWTARVSVWATSRVSRGVEHLAEILIGVVRSGSR